MAERCRVSRQALTNIDGTELNIIYVLQGAEDMEAYVQWVCSVASS